MRSAAEFGRHLLTVFEEGQDVTLDLANLAEVDLSFIQLVCAAREQLARDGRALRLTAPAPEPVAALLERAGFLTDPTPADTEFWFHGDLPR